MKKKKQKRTDKKEKEKERVGEHGECIERKRREVVFFIYFLIFKWDMLYLQGCEVSVKK